MDAMPSDFEAVELIHVQHTKGLGVPLEGVPDLPQFVRSDLLVRQLVEERPVRPLPAQVELQGAASSRTQALLVSWMRWFAAWASVIKPMASASALPASALFPSRYCSLSFSRNRSKFTFRRAEEDPAFATSSAGTDCMPSWIGARTAISLPRSSSVMVSLCSFLAAVSSGANSRFLARTS